jgi:hypothetical protein
MNSTIRNGAISTGQQGNGRRIRNHENTNNHKNGCVIRYVYNLNMKKWYRK